MKSGQDVYVEFEDGEEPLLGHVDRIERGWARCTVLIDPEADFGSGTERLSPHQTVCVPLSRVRPRD